MIVEDFVCSKNSLIDLLAKYFPRMSLNMLHSSKICLTVRGQLHLSHTGRLSPDRRYLCVRPVCPMRSLMMMVLSRRVRPCSDLVLPMTGLISKSLLFVSAVHFSCHVLWHSSVTRGRKSLAGYFILVIGKQRADFATVSAFSFSLILT